MDIKPEKMDFIRERIRADIASGKYGGKVVTRFPPEPNGYLHLGHAKSICLNFGIAEEFGGRCHLRFDDTNPVKEDIEYVESIKRDINWLGFDWGVHEYYTSNYFEKIYMYAEKLVEAGKAYIDDQSADRIRETRGTLREPGKDSPFRNRRAEENLELFRKMRAGEFPDGAMVLRAKIDMSHPNLDMRDPVIYRIRHAEHHRTGNKWCIYPMYDFAHCLSDAIEGITHSICTLEFEDNRVLYNWFLNSLGFENPPEQIEFARLNVTYTALSKRKLSLLVKNRVVDGWDDPRMPTLSGLKRRGYPPEALRNFCDIIGVAKTNSTVEIGLLEHCLRDELNKTAGRVMAVLDPVKLVIENYPADREEWVEADNNPEEPAAGKRKVPFTKELYIEREDFMENPPKKYFRLFPGKEVRLKHAYYVTCKEVIKDSAGIIKEIICLYDPESSGGGTPDNRRVQGTLHWVSAKKNIPVEVRLFSNLFSVQDPDAENASGDFTGNLSPDSLKIPENCYAEISLKEAQPGEVFQFLRLGYFVCDKSSRHPVRDKSSMPDKVIFNRTATLKDTWTKLIKI